MKHIVTTTLKNAGRFYPFLSGRGYLTGKPLYTWAASGCQEHEWATLRNGRRLLVDPREDLGRSAYPRFSSAFTRVGRIVGLSGSAFYTALGLPPPMAAH